MPVLPALSFMLLDLFDFAHDVLPSIVHITLDKAIQSNGVVRIMLSQAANECLALLDESAIPKQALWLKIAMQK